MQWSGDTQRSPPGAEQLTISRWLNADYDVLIHDYSGSLDFPNGEVTVEVNLIPGDRKFNFTPSQEVGRWWHVCRIRGPECRVEEINRVLTECPYSIQ